MGNKNPFWSPSVHLVAGKISDGKHSRSVSLASSHFSSAFCDNPDWTCAVEQGHDQAQTYSSSCPDYDLGSCYICENLL
jgi:hypothetical protein